MMRVVLLILLSFVVLTTIPAGVLLMFEPNGSSMGISVDILAGTPFNDFFIAGLMLTLLIGGGSLISVLLILTQSWWSYKLALTSGIILVLWVLDGFISIPHYHWLQGLYLAIGVLISLASYQLMGKAAF